MSISLAQTQVGKMIASLVRESSAILFDADISMRILLDEGSYTTATIVFDKVRQGQRAKSLRVEIEGWFQTIVSKEVVEEYPGG